VTNLLQHLGSCIREKRIQKNLSQEELAARASLHRTYIGAIERGERNPTILALQRISNALDMTLVELLAHCSESSQIS
jgi:transcriptional regulator with XRE-family HTH domain